jgi:hypothetical protein
MGVNMSEERSLIVGFDLCDDFSQISCFNKKTFEPESICFAGEEGECLIPTVLAVKKDTCEWVYGQEAILLSNREEAVKINHILKQLKDKKEIMVFDSKIDAISLLERFFRKSLSLLKIKYPNEMIDKIVITVEKLDKDVIKGIYKALEGLLIKKDRVSIISHEGSLAHYTLNQHKELYMNDVGLFDFTKSGLFYYQLSIDRRHHPHPVTIVKKDCSDMLTLEMVTGQAYKNCLKYLFQNIANSILHKQIISTLFFTGIGFEGDWADEIMKSLGVGRRIFKGQNLYAKGACYAARTYTEPDRMKDFIIVTDEMITSSVSILAYYDAKVSEILIAKAATPWYNISEKFYLILDEKEEIEVFFKDMKRKEPICHVINLEGLPKRPKKMTKVLMKFEFVDKNTCVITVKDDGFGDFYPSTNRVWEKTMQLPTT